MWLLVTKETDQLSQASSITVLISCMKIELLGPNHLPDAPHANTMGFISPHRNYRL